MEYIVLNNGVKCPIIGIGTFMLSPVDAENSVREALKMGYSLVDTANAYVNERAVGRGMKESGAKREDIFLSTKLWPSEYENPNAVEETLARLGVDYVDLLYIHQPAGNWLAGYRQLEKAYRDGSPSVLPPNRASANPGQIRHQAHELVSLGPRRQVAVTGGDFCGSREKVWQEPGAGHSSLAHADGLCGDPWQQKRRSHPGQSEYPRFRADR